MWSSSFPVIWVSVSSLLFFKCAAHNGGPPSYRPGWHTGHESCCQYLQHSLGSMVSYPNTTTYSTSLNSYWTQQESSLKPSCIVSPTCSEDVSQAIRLLAKRSQCKFAVRGGGHTPWAGAANIQDGVTIDLSAINTITLSTDRSIASVGGGARLGQVYRYLDPLNLGVVGGRVSQVGIGGIIVGGGISFFSPRFGFACDAVESFELVGADGIISNISATNKPDLYRALKGGSNNFGIVTHYNLYTFPSGDIWGGNVYNDMSTLPQQAIAFENLAGNPNYDEYAALIHNYVWFDYEPQGIIVNQFTYTKVPATNATPEFFSDFTSIPSQGNTTSVKPLHEITDAIAPPNNYTRTLFITLSYANNAHFYTSFLALFNSTLHPLLPQIPQITLSFQALPPIITSRTNGTNVLNYPANTSVVNALGGAAWYDAENDELIYSAMQEVFDKGEEMAKNMGLDVGSLYLNYAAKWQDPIGGYGEANVEFLRNVSREYDPQGMWQTQMPGGFKLWTGRGTG